MRSLLGVIVGSSPKLRVIGEAANGNEAVAQTKRLRPDVIVLDLAMPVCSGLEALPELRRVAPDARVVVYSGFADGIATEEVIVLGAAAYLEKGAPPEATVATIEGVLAPRTSASATTT